MKDVITLCFPAKMDYIAPIRLAVSGIVSHLDMDVEQLENMKTCITEACTLLICSQRCSVFHVEITVSDDGIGFTVEGPASEKISECRGCMQFNAEVSRMLISAMSRTCDFISDDGGALRKVVFGIPFNNGRVG